MFETPAIGPIIAIFVLFFVMLPNGAPLAVGVFLGRRAGGLKVLMPLCGFLIGFVL